MSTKKKKKDKYRKIIDSYSPVVVDAVIKKAKANGVI